MQRTPSRVFLLLSIACVCVQASGGEWRIGGGIHSFIVPQANSDTFGINATITYESTSETELHNLFQYDLYKDFDHDELDPDHIPIWWRIHYLWERPFKQLSPDWTLWGAAEVRTRMNTVSCIERQIDAYPSLSARYEGNALHTSLELGGGYFFLEIDDDVPKERGYQRGDFKHKTLAAVFTANATLDLSKNSQLFGEFRNWTDSDGWLENQFRAELHVDVAKLHRDSELILGAETFYYNLDPYLPSGNETNPETGDYIPILPWDHDVMVRASIKTAW